MIVLSAVFHAVPGKEDALKEVLLAMFPFVKEEAGTVTYNLNQSRNNPGTFFFYERYKDQAAFDFHGSTPHFQELNNNLDGLLTEPPKVDLYEELDAIGRS